MHEGSSTILTMRLIFRFQSRETSVGSAAEEFGRVYVYWSPSTGEVDWKMSLHGVAFYQLPIIAERRIIRCHGAQTIHAAVAQTVKAPRQQN